MIDALMAGSLIAAPQEKTSANGKTYVQCRMRVPAGDETLFVMVTAFDVDVRRALLALGAGDSVAVAGPLKVGIWSPSNGADPRVNVTLIANALVSSYHVKRKRQAMQPEQDAPPRSRGEPMHEDALDF